MLLLALPTIVSIAIAIILFVSFSVGLYFICHRYWPNGISDETKETANAVATRIGLIHSVVIGMIFTGVHMEYSEMIVAVESEASALMRFYNAMEHQGVKN